MALIRLLARPLLASYFIANGVDSLRNANALAAQAAPVTEKLQPVAQRAVPNVTVPKDPTLWVRANGAVQIVAGAALATGHFPRLASGVLAASLVPSTATRYRFWEAQDKAVRSDQQTHFLKNAALAGGLAIAAGDTAGKPGLLWRARHTAKDVRREAAHAVKDAKLEAKAFKAAHT
ncbi:putative membrane protein YphA (DoxX/SURF4 family) [Nocardioides thalensis]|uniref:Putative membrane protein YphA (DoxX/SURF4 family) n=1 Tax=Nocardioides thalensis TaxID=1914755 RepID=A0A853C7F0_9ACTN|nr:DoxX family protein [Nocardioides thalensis]NYJ02133.1 putative membrane protein YphA (DoxX/SURF4 family) [Nocardioides thalensis]